MTYLFAILAGVFLALMDTFENENFHESIFKNWNQKFWYKRESWKWAKKIFGWKFDSWHVSKSFMMLAYPTMASFYAGTEEAFFRPFTDNYHIYGKIMYILISGTLTFTTFNLFYNHIFKSKK